MKAIAAATLLCLVAAQDQPEKVTFTWAPKQGDKFRTDQAMGMKIKVAIAANGEKQTIEAENRMLQVQNHEVLEVADGKVRKMVFDTEKDIEEQKPPGAEEFMTQKKPLHGTRITVTDKGGKLSYEGADGVDEKAVKKLDLEPDKFAKTFPEKAIAVGEGWKVTGDKVREILGSGDQDMKGGTIECTLKSVKEIDGRRCAVLDITLELKGKSAEQIELEMNLSGEIIVLIDRGYTLSAKLKGRVSMESENEQMSMKGDGPITVDITGTLK